ncbi:hypothetical protein DYB25_007428 [Aphanomyces astaci]|uniref:DDE-1 domain-containing protein n=1 Tax=Aphanomyces astaci TaxID=112090 RepID=A0A397DM16_APHAT|nr:hypothetical protein DYB25_007428 [Aphanomyces astaci]RHY33298.1 hypothetical protein DYB34_008073 [Aphanomyces astaci]RHY53393.1 hypothetical protein DYB38_005280 [Aphanomyces astaci]RHY63967.1 hypothetical protein DYB30_001116 [Aphanomyces astaci]
MDVHAAEVVFHDVEADDDRQEDVEQDYQDEQTSNQRKRKLQQVVPVAKRVAVINWMIKDADDNGIDGNIMRVITAFPAEFRGEYKLSLSPAKKEHIEKTVAYHLGELQRGFASGDLDEDLLCNMDETHFVINEDNGRTLGFRGDSEVKYADVVSGGVGMTMMDHSHICAMSGVQSDQARTLQSVRSRADHLRHTIQTLEQLMAWHPLTQWPEFLSKFQVVAKQLENIMGSKDDDDSLLPESLHHWVCAPRMSLPDPSHIPILLRTREDPEMEKRDEELGQADTASLLPHHRKRKADWTWDELDLQKENFNTAVEGFEDALKKSSDELLKRIKVGKFKDVVRPTFTQTDKYVFMETGQWPSAQQQQLSQLKK